jgi:hypothetical protein
MVVRRRGDSILRLKGSKWKLERFVLNVKKISSSAIIPPISNAQTKEQPHVKNAFMKSQLSQHWSGEKKIERDIWKITEAIGKGRR